MRWEIREWSDDGRVSALYSHSSHFLFSSLRGTSERSERDPKEREGVKIEGTGWARRSEWQETSHSHGTLLIHHVIIIDVQKLLKLWWSNKERPYLSPLSRYHYPSLIPALGLPSGMIETGITRGERYATLIIVRRSLSLLYPYGFSYNLLLMIAWLSVSHCHPPSPLSPCRRGSAEVNGEVKVVRMTRKETDRKSWKESGSLHSLSIVRPLSEPPLFPHSLLHSVHPSLRSVESDRREWSEDKEWRMGGERDEPIVSKWRV